MKKLVVTLLVGTIWFTGGMQANATDMRDIFDAEYYADRYDDLEKAFGDNEEALYQHFVEYGLKEGRNMNPVIDIVKYREQYGDLDKAFGDNWDAYVEHYFTYGVKENRDNGTAFDVQKYVTSYEDLYEAFGDDYTKAAEHYIKYGKDENRDKGNKHHSVSPSKQPHVEPEVDEPSLETTETTMLADGSWYVSEYSANGLMTKRSFYFENGELERYFTCRYNDAGQLIGEDYYDAQGVLTTYSQRDYYDDGNYVVTTMINSDGTYSINLHDHKNKTHDVLDYDADHNFLSWFQWNIGENGEYIDCREFNEDGTLRQEYELSSSENGNTVFVPENSEDNTEEDNTEIGYTGIDEYVNEDGSKVVKEYVNGFLIKVSEYNANGELDCYSIFTYNEDGIEIGFTNYDGNGNITSYTERRLDENGAVVESRYVDAEGNVSLNQYDRVNCYQTVLSYDAEGNLLSRDVFKWVGNFQYVELKTYDAEGNLIGEYDVIKDEDGNDICVPREA